MTQVRTEYSRAILAHFLNSGAYLSAPEQSLKDLPTKTIHWTFKTALIAALKELTPERFTKIRDEAFAWLQKLTFDEQKRVLAEVDGIEAPLPMPRRLNWSDYHHGAHK